MRSEKDPSNASRVSAVAAGVLGTLVVIGSLSDVTDPAFIVSHGILLALLLGGLVAATRAGRPRLRLAALGALSCEAGFLVLSQLVAPGLVGS